MIDYTTINNYSFSFSDHPTCPAFSAALNDTYSEPFAATVAVALFTNATQTTVAPNILPVLQAAVIDTIMLSTTADRAVVASIINSMLLFTYTGNLCIGQVHWLVEDDVFYC